MLPMETCGKLKVIHGPPLPWSPVSTHQTCKTNQEAAVMAVEVAVMAVEVAVMAS